MINYYLLTKPGIILGNLLTVAAGFILGLQGSFEFLLFFATLIGLALIIASACVFNNHIDRKVDKKMDRTKNRALARGLISSRNAILFAIVLMVLGFFILLTYTNVLTALIAGLGFLIYVVIYSLWKCHTIYATAIGSIAGAIPPVVGYCAATGRFDLGAAILFAMMVLWQMPHFFSIAIFHFDDYAAASIPTFPGIRGIYATKLRMVVYVIGFIITASLLTVFAYTGYVYLVAMMLVSILWLIACLKGFKCDNDQNWARHTFRLSLIAITAICLATSVEHFIAH